MSTFIDKRAPGVMPGASKWYVGYTVEKPSRFQAFKCSFLPTDITHGLIYFAVIGPFRTKRAALWAETYGLNNPHFQHVRDAERISAMERKVSNV